MYYLVEKKLRNEDAGDYVAYGVKCSECEIDDISVNRKMVEKFVLLLNEQNASPIHLKEMVDDLLGREYGL